MNEIIKIDKKRLTNSQHFEFMNSFKNLVVSMELHTDARLVETCTAFGEAFEEEDRYFLISQGSELTEALTNADKARDRDFSCLRNIVNAWAANDAMVPQQTEALKVKKIIDRYKIDIEAQQDSESALIRNLIADLKEQSAAMAITNLNLKILLDDLELRNNEFTSILAQRDAENAQKQKGALRNARLVVDEQYENLLKIFEVFAMLGDNSEVFDNFITTWNATIIRYKQMLDRKENNGSEDEDDEDYDPEDNNNGTNGTETEDPNDNGGGTATDDNNIVIDPDEGADIVIENN